MPVPQLLAAPQALTILSGLQALGGGSRGVRPDGTREWLMVATLGGLGTVQAGDAWHELRRGDVFLIAPGTRQAYGHAEDRGQWLNIWVHFRPRSHWLPWLKWPELGKGVMRLRCEPAFSALEADLRQMVEVASRPQRLSLDASMNCLERFLIAADECNPEQRSAIRDARIHKALELIGERLAEPLNSAALGLAIGLSRARFTTLFTQQVGLSPQVYIETLRLTRAAHLLQTSSWQIAQIGESVGFQNAFYFSARFRRHFGVPPATYRSILSTARAST
ncbi:helix-turn-helix domain-containing protein [Paucibacter sp. M5-1]|uniref:helix-turn-helix domain-containing protein n=1 Tax=Paucibacter sp. M5-1 TaxID=3015998 RepID=UPI0022B89C83|nr:helix-turn-helix domain-containing protein [Paucibacter sp. M5-1]MCZ7883039.1 helix-turn-helix domain-containing protein [Paucibacter sp. M5-1]